MINSKVYNFTDISALLRFPLAVMIVMIHAHMLINVPCDECITKWGGVFSCDLSEYALYADVSFIISEIISRTAIYLFFFISGFLFFYNIGSRFTISKYKSKLLRRVYSLLIPYLFWNALVILLFYCVQTITPGLTSGNNMFVSDWSCKEWLSAFWAYDNGHPINSPFWFIRDLMVVCLFSPVIYWLNRNNYGFLFVVILFLMWSWGCYSGIPGLNTDAFFFFSLGAFYSTERKDIINLCDRLLYLAITIALFSIFIQLWAFNRGNLNNDYLDVLVFFCQRLGFMALMVLVIFTAGKFLESGADVNKLLNKSNFFIYAYHSVALGFLCRIRERLIQPSNDIEALLIYFIQPTIIICLGVLIFMILNTYTPSFTKLITGSRQ